VAEVYAREVGAQSELAPFLRATGIIVHGDPAICAQALALASTGSIESARRSFEWVRDEIRHAVDFRVDVVTCSASETLPDMGWYRCDPHGNKSGVDAQFTPPVERLAFTDAAYVPGVFSDPLPKVVQALRTSRTLAESLAALPDL
jgi:hypothetical protein